MRAKHPSFPREQFLEKLSLSVEAFFLAGKLNRGIYTRQDRPHYILVLKLNHGVDEQVGSIRPCLVQTRYGELYTHSS
jgi:hypothetical protein